VRSAAWAGAAACLSGVRSVVMPTRPFAALQGCGVAGAPAGGAGGEGFCSTGRRGDGQACRRPLLPFAFARGGVRGRFGESAPTDVVSGVGRCASQAVVRLWGVCVFGVGVTSSHSCTDCRFRVALAGRRWLGLRLGACRRAVLCASVRVLLGSRVICMASPASVRVVWVRSWRVRVFSVRARARGRRASVSAFLRGLERERGASAQLRACAARGQRRVGAWPWRASVVSTRYVAAAASSVCARRERRAAAALGGSRVGGYALDAVGCRCGAWRAAPSSWQLPVSAGAA